MSVAELQDGAALYREAFRAGIEPDPELLVWEWAEKYRQLPRQASEPGPYRTDRTPYVREVLEHLSPSSPTDLVVWMKGAQIAASTCAENLVGYIMDTGSGPTMIVRPTEADAKKVSKKRIQPMINSTPRLRRRVGNARARESGNNILEKEFPGGSLSLVGANSPVGMRGVDIRNLILDELDAFPHDVGGEGDPVALAEKRTDTFKRNRKRFYLSTPTVRGVSRIEKLFLETDQRYFFVPCPHCGVLQPIKWANIKWDDGDPTTVGLECEACRVRILEHHKTAMLRAGRWQATAEASRPGVVGYHLSGLYSPLGWYSWEDAVRDFLEAKADGPESLKAWTNTVLGETWEEAGEQIAPEVLLARCEEFETPAPDGVLLVTGGVDVQDNRLEVELAGWGMGYESWSVAYRILYGDPLKDAVWHQLTEVLESTWEHADGDHLPVAGMAVDSGYLADRVYEFVRHHGRARHVHAIRGRGGMGMPLVSAPRRIRTGRTSTPVDVFMVGVDTAMGILYSRLQQAKPGPGCCHYPVGRDLEYFEQLTAKKRITTYTRGLASHKWVNTHTRDEALDTRVYNMAELQILAPLWDIIAADRAKAREGVEEEPQRRGILHKRRRRWVTDYRG